MPDLFGLPVVVNPHVPAGMVLLFAGRTIAAAAELERMKKELTEALYFVSAAGIRVGVTTPETGSPLTARPKIERPAAKEV